MNLPAAMTWSPGEASTLNEFLNSPVGRKWLGLLLLRKPPTDLSSVERAAISAAYAAGYERIFGEIAATRTSLPEAESPSISAINPAKD